MSEMNGYVFTQKIKADKRLAHLPLNMHSSLTAATNQAMGQDIGSDVYVSKFYPLEFALTLRRLLINND